MMSATPTVTIPASKSVSHRALIAAGLATGRSKVANVLDSDDLGVTRACLEAGGVGIAEEGGLLVVDGVPAGLQGGAECPVIMNVRESGTSCRLLTAVAAAGRGLFEFRGEGRMHERPIGELARAVHSQGPDVAWLEKTGYPPFRLHTEGLRGGLVTISLEESSQYLSGLLLAAPLAAKATTIELTGDKVVSWPYVGLTLQILADFGIDFAVEVRSGETFEVADWRAITAVRPGEVRFRLNPGSYHSRDYRVEGDWSSASYFLAAGAVAGPLTVAGLRTDSVQGDRQLLNILDAMGAKVSVDEANQAVTVAPGRLTGVTVDMNRCPDIVPTVAVLASFAQGPTTVSGVPHLRLKESDRLAAMAGEIAKTGCKVEVHDDGLTVHPAPLPRGRTIAFTTYGDHRVPMSLALYALAGITLEFDNKACVAKSFPGFWQAFEAVREALK
jgi:3-phosphoshikimate 1-carboxyvinyltransferase